MVITTAPYPDPADRLDRLSLALGASDLSAGIEQVISHFPNWDGGMFIDGASARGITGAYTRPEESLTAEALVLKRQLDGEPGRSANNFGFDPATQEYEDLTRTATSGEAAFWAAQMRCLLIQGELFGAPEAGTTLIVDILSNPITPGNLRQWTSDIQNYLLEDEDWYNVFAVSEYIVPSIVQSILDIEVNAR